MVTRAGTEHPFDVAISGPWVFWTDWLAHGVFRADKRAGGATPLRRDVPRPMAIVAVAPHHQTCESWHTTCVHLLLSSPYLSCNLTYVHK